MTHIEQMIKDMCPHGVEFKTLGEVCTIETGKLNANAAEENGQYPFFTTSKEISYINEYKWDTEALLIAGNANIGDVKHYIGKFNAYQRTYVLTNFQDGLIVRFLYHYTKARLKDFLDDKKNEAAMSYIVLSSLQAFPIPLPPLEIQKKIVECLDKFSALAAELQAELQMRRKQYEYYRTQLLTPHSDCNSADNTDDRKLDSQGYIKGIAKVYDWQWKTLGEIFELRGGYTPSKNNPAFWEGGTIPWFRMEDIRLNGRILEDAIQHITPAAVKGKGLFEKNTFILATTATIGEHALLIADSLANQRFTNLKIRKSLEDSLLTKFVFHYMFIVDEYCKVHTNVSGFESVDMDALKKMPFPIPPLAEQARIVAILDKFEALTTSLSDGIPAEQAAQQKRYEYYRDLLLTFDRKAE